MHWKPRLQIKALILFVMIICAFIQSQAEAASPDLFSNQKGQTLPNLDFTLKAPFGDLFEHREIPNMPKDPKLAGYSVEGEISYLDSQNKKIILPVKVQLRGNTSQSRTECLFPKLRLKLDPAHTKGTVFQNHSTVGIGTHCNDKGGASRLLKRSWSGKAPHREALVYALLEELGFTSLKVRKAVATYVDSREKMVLNQKAQAFFLEDSSDLQARMQSKEVLEIEERERALKKAKWADKYSSVFYTNLRLAPKVSSDELARLFLFQSLIGNDDWALRMDENEVAGFHSLYNIKILEAANGSWSLVPYDFDLAGMVNEAGSQNRFIILKSRLPSESRRAAIQFYEQHRDTLYRLSSQLKSDPVGEKNYLLHLDQFYRILRSF